MTSTLSDWEELGLIFGGSATAVVAVLFAMTYVPDQEPPPNQPVAQLAKAEAPPAREVAPVVTVVPAAAPTKAREPAKALTFKEQLELGKELFTINCVACHRANGEGMPGMFPPLAKSDYLMADKKRSVGILLKGLSGPIEVNGAKFNSMMPPVGAQLSDGEIAGVLTYVRNSFGNKGEAVKAEEVAAVREPSGT